MFTFVRENGGQILIFMGDLCELKYAQLFVHHCFTDISSTCSLGVAPNQPQPTHC